MGFKDGTIGSDLRALAHVRAKDVARYAVLPGIFPRIRNFAGSGFSWLACLMAVIYAAVRLLPPDHPYLNPANRGRFGVRHVIAQAASRLVLKKENADQMLVFAALLMGFVLLGLQVFMLLFQFIISPALAGGASNFAGLFTTPNPDNDIAFMLLDKIFAVPDLYGSKFAPASAGAIPAFNRALQQLFQYYNTVILIVGVFIFIYYVVIVVGETMQTGTPFGRRFAHIWAPMRLVAAVGLLVPLNYGFNSAQYITLFAAKLGSSFATNGWIVFNKGLTEGGGAGASPTTYTEKESLIVRPNRIEAQKVQNLIAFMAVVRTCQKAYAEATKNEPQPIDIRAYLARGDQNIAAEMPGDYDSALQFYENGDVRVIFGHLDQNDQKNEGGVNPLCGQVTVHTNDVTQAGPLYMQRAYYDAISAAMTDTNLEDFAEHAVALFQSKSDIDPCSTGAAGKCTQLDPYVKKQNMVDQYLSFWATLPDQARQAQVDQVTNVGIPQDLMDKGWAGAGIWYNRIAQWNGSFVASVVNIPTPSRMPHVMEYVEEKKRGDVKNIEAKTRFKPEFKNGEAIPFNVNYEYGIADTLSKTYSYLIDADVSGNMSGRVSGNIFFDAINMIFGTSGLFDMRKNEDIHPLAQLVGIGKGVLESTIRNLMTALAFSFLGGMGEVINPHMGGMLHSASSIFVSMASVGITIGFLLFYVLPFMPFIYFFFAVSRWVKSVFEAMVGTPLWALAHLKIDGEGLSGDHARNGYFMILEIFLRPILCVFGLLAGLAVFSALARTFNNIFSLVVMNLTGFDCTDCDAGAANASFGLEFRRNNVDELFYTVVYAIFVYMLATSSFKMIDQVPDFIMRWMGAGVQTFGEKEDPTSGLASYAALGTKQISAEVVNIAQSGARGAGWSAGKAMETLSGRNSTKIRVAGSGPGSGGNP